MAGNERAARRPNPPGLREELFARQGGRCPICANAIVDISGTEIDHRVPICKGGSDEAENKQLVHRICNRTKGGREEEDLRSRGVFPSMA
jgi:5-methylcytosine-specific restriction endonuclease McrA